MHVSFVVLVGLQTVFIAFRFWYQATFGAYSPANQIGVPYDALRIDRGPRVRGSHHARLHGRLLDRLSLYTSVRSLNDILTLVPTISTTHWPRPIHDRRVRKRRQASTPWGLPPHPEVPLFAPTRYVSTSMVRCWAWASSAFLLGRENPVNSEKPCKFKITLREKIWFTHILK